MLKMIKIIFSVLFFLVKITAGSLDEDSTVDRHEAFHRYLRESKGLDHDNEEQQQQNERRRMQFQNTFSIVKAGQPSSSTDAQVILGTWSSGSTIDIAPYVNFDISLIVYTARSYTRVELDFEAPTRLDYVAPWSLRGQSGNNYIASTWMKIIGTKTIRARGYDSWNRLVASSTISFTLIDTSKTLPPQPQTCTIPQVCGT
jgi:hypothetical protein